jgi:hypothetical protein
MLDTYIGFQDGDEPLRGGTLEPLGLDGERASMIHAWRQDGVTTVSPARRATPCAAAPRRPSGRESTAANRGGPICGSAPLNSRLWFGLPR